MIKKPEKSEVGAWVTLRHALWPHHDIEELATEAKAMLESDSAVCFLAADESSRLVGFIEGEIHSTPTGPYGHVEGWYVVPEFRKQGYGKKLMGQFEHWCLHRAIYLVTSDTTVSYPLSPSAHERCGFRQIHDFKIFMKDLQPEGLGYGSQIRRT